MIDNELSKPVQRKLTTILAADVVGFSRMMGIDEDNTHNLLRKFRKVFDRNITHYSGRIFNTAGDSIMSEFPSTVEAVRCAIDIQEEIAAYNNDRPEKEQMWFRIGLNVGDVIIEGNDLIGDGVNIAARMESIATPGGICLSGSVYDLVHNKLSFSFKNMGEQSVKNIIEPVPAYSLLPTIVPENIARTINKSSPKRQIPLALFLLTAIILIIFLFAYKNEINLLSRSDPTRNSNISSKHTITEEPIVSSQTRITPSYFFDRTIEGITGKTNERFVIEMTNQGNAVVTIYEKNVPDVRRGSDSGTWWINKHDRICFKFKKFAKGKKFCRIFSLEKNSEYLVSGDPEKNKWKLLPK